MPDEDKAQLHAIVEGRVQGVSFRYFVAEQAESLELTGWVRNLWNGSVEVTVEGPRHSLERILQDLYKGPPMARVTSVNFEWQSYTGKFIGFQVRSTHL